MSDDRRDGPDDPRQDQLLEDLGRVARARRARGQAEVPPYRPPDDERIEALLDMVDGRGPRLVASPRPIGPTERPRSPLIGYMVTALATAAAVVLVLRAPSETPAPFPSSETPQARLDAPTFGSWRIDGGGPPVAHQGEPDPSTQALVCSTRALQLVLAVSSTDPIDRAAPLQLVIMATAVDGTSHRYLYEVDDDDRISWTPDGRALLLRGTLQGLAPLPPGPWVLEPRVGPPGACTSGDENEACTSLEARAIEVDGEPCDAEP